MGVLDVFNSDAFSMVNLTTAINKLPYQPSQIGQAGYFRTRPTDKTVIAVESRNGILSLLKTTPRGIWETVRARGSRNIKSFAIPHIAISDTVMADDVQNIRAFGSETKTESVAQKVNDVMEGMRQDHETTHEYHRCGAIQGKVLDADGTTVIFNYFTEFGVTEQTTDFKFTVETTDIKKACTAVERQIQAALGAAAYTGITAWCSDTFFDALTAHAEVKLAFDRWKDGAFLREQQTGPVGFEYGGVRWINYRGSIGAVPFIPANTARFVPTGVMNLFERHNAPAEFIESVNTMGKPIYAKTRVLEFETGVEILSVSNPLFLPTRPRALVKGTMS